MLGVTQRRATTTIAQSAVLAQTTTTTTTTNTRSKTRTKNDKEKKKKTKTNKTIIVLHKSKRGKPLSNSCNKHLKHY
jgi:hypothetical protein